MRERVEAAGGRCNIRATAGSGTRLEIAVPMELAHGASASKV
jgi:signal transduction histidine kinase